MVRAARIMVRRHRAALTDGAPKLSAQRVTVAAARKTTAYGRSILAGGTKLSPRADAEAAEFIEIWRGATAESAGSNKFLRGAPML
jgi:hypothetical protein